jgi:NodT family efflux transporter outer membrane factor (OMF) lipoprotein
MVRFLPIALVALATMITGCQSPPPTPPVQPPNLPSGYPSLAQVKSGDLLNMQNLDEQSLAKALGNWWQVFNDPILSKLTTQAITANWNLLAAVQNLEAAKANIDLVNSYRLPSVSVAAVGGRQQSGTTNALAVGLYDTFGIATVVAWEPDVFGRVAAQVSAAEADKNRAEADRRAVMVSVTAQLAATYAQLRARQQALMLSKQYVSQIGAKLALTQQLLKVGIVPITELAQMKRLYLQAQSSIPTLESQIKVLMTTCAILTGGYANDLDALLNQPGPLLVSQAHLPSTLPSQLLRQRPDIVAQEQRILASVSDVQVAEANFMPQFNIPLGIGYNAGPFSLLLNPASFIWNLTVNAMAPLYTGDQLEAQLKIAQAVSRKDQLLYENIIRQALKEVENAVVSYQGASESLLFLDQVKQQQSVVVAQEQILLNTGVQSEFQLLTSKMNLTQVDEGIVNAKFEQTTNLISLYKALGSGWSEIQLSEVKQ